MIKRLKKFFSKIRNTRVIALVGKSGTGKSFRSQLLVEKFNIDILIDDGLIIKDQKILAGISAKKEKTYLSAVKTALFEDSIHRKEAINILRTIKPKNILLLGTSQKMILHICQQLSLPNPAKIITIEDISSAQDINTALSQRKYFGKHVIPIPALTVHQKYPRLIVESLKVFFHRRFRLFQRKKSYEKSAVQPEFSSGSNISISQEALQQMLQYCIAEFDTSITLTKILLKKQGNNFHADLYVEVPYRFDSSSSLFKLREYILRSIERYSRIPLEDLNITVSKIKK